MFDTFFFALILNIDPLISMLDLLVLYIVSFDLKSSYLKFFLFFSLKQLLEMYQITSYSCNFSKKFNLNLCILTQALKPFDTDSKRMHFIELPYFSVFS